MKKTINVNLGGMVFQIDEDAYELLSKYLEKLKTKFHNTVEREEIIEDIEFRFAEIFVTKINKQTEVISTQAVEEAIGTMGTPEEIEESEEEATGANTNSKGADTGVKKLYRDPDDKVIAGVLAGLGHYIGVEAVWLRLIWIILTIASVGVPTVAIYFILWLVVPKASSTSEKLQMKGEAVNLSSIEASVKKNLSSESIQKTTKNIGNSLGEIVRVAAYVMVIGAAIILGFKLFVFTIAFALGTVIPTVSAASDLHLLFNSTWQYILGMVSVYFLVAVPIATCLYLCLRLLSKQKIHWGTTLGISAILWTIGLVVASTIALLTLNQFKEQASGSHYVEFPNQKIATLKIDIPSPDEDYNFKIDYDGGMIRTDGFEYDETSNTLMINAVSMKIIESADTTFKLYIKNSSRGKTKSDAEQHLANFVENSSFTNDSTLYISPTVVLKDENKWRYQNTKYTLHVPVGKEIYFSSVSNAVQCNMEFSGPHSKKSLLENKWVMTNNGLKCLSCLDE